MQHLDHLSLHLFILVCEEGTSGTGNRMSKCMGEGVVAVCS